LQKSSGGGLEPKQGRAKAEHPAWTMDQEDPLVKDEFRPNPDGGKIEKTKARGSIKQATCPKRRVQEVGGSRKRGRPVTSPEAFTGTEKLNLHQCWYWVNHRGNRPVREKINR